MSEFKLQLPVADSASSNGAVEETLCGYMARNSKGFSWPFYASDSYNYKPSRFYRLVYRYGKNGASGGGTLPAASAQLTTMTSSTTAVDAEQEERRLMATEDSCRRYC